LSTRSPSLGDLVDNSPRGAPTCKSAAPVDLHAGLFGAPLFCPAGRPRPGFVFFKNIAAVHEPQTLHARWRYGVGRMATDRHNGTSPRSEVFAHIFCFYTHTETETQDSGEVTLNCAKPENKIETFNKPLITTNPLPGAPPPAVVRNLSRPV
jgi:hypothetical protein